MSRADETMRIVIKPPAADDQSLDDLEQELDSVDKLLQDVLGAGELRLPGAAMLFDAHARQQLALDLSSTTPLPTGPPVPPGTLSSKTLSPGDRVGDCEIVEYLTKGGCGLIFRARNRRLEIDTAVKVMHPKSFGDPAAPARFLREARAMAKVRHSHVLRIYDIGELDDETLYLVCDYIDGPALDTFIRQRQTIDLDQCLQIMQQVTAGLAAVHSHGIIHRDLKPGNIMLTKDGEAVLMDFGMVKFDDPAALDTEGLTKAGYFVGTPLYAPPEQLSGGGKVGTYSDVYALGMTFYELLTGKRPVTGDTVAEVVHQQLHVLPDAPRQINPEIPPALDSLIMRMLAKDPAARPADAGALLAELAQLTSSDAAIGDTATLPADDDHAAGGSSGRVSPGAVRSWRLWAGAAVVLGLIGLVVWQQRPQPAPQAAAAPPAPPAATSAGDETDAWSARPRVYCILPFSTDDPALADDLSGQIEQQLTAMKCKVVVRQRLGATGGEPEPAPTKPVDAATAVGIGSAVGAHLVIAGHIATDRGAPEADLRVFNADTGETITTAAVTPATIGPVVDLIRGRVAAALTYRSTIADIHDDGSILLRQGRLHGAAVGMQLRVLDGDMTLTALRITHVGDHSAKAVNALVPVQLRVGLRVEEVKN